MYTKEYKVVCEMMVGELVEELEQVFDDLETATSLFNELKSKEFSPIIIEITSKVVYNEDEGRDNSFSEIISEEVIMQ